jgi:hypothetical protein
LDCIFVDNKSEKIANCPLNLIWEVFLEWKWRKLNFMGSSRWNLSDSLRLFYDLQWDSRLSPIQILVKISHTHMKMSKLLMISTHTAQDFNDYEWASCKQFSALISCLFSTKLSLFICTRTHQNARWSSNGSRVGSLLWMSWR